MTAIEPSAASPGRAWAHVGLAFLFMLVNYADKAVIGLSSVPIMRDLGLSSTQFGELGSAFFLLFSISGAAGGVLADHVPTKTLMLGMAVVWGLALLPVSFASSFMLLLLSRILLGAAEGPAFPVALHSVYKWFSDRGRALPTSIVACGAAFGTGIVAPLVTRIIGSYGWRAAFGALAAVGLAWAGIWFLFAREGPLGDLPAAGGGEARRIPYARLLASRTSIGVFVAGFAAYAVIALNITWLANYLIRGLRIALAEAAWVIGLPSLMQLVLAPGLALVSQRLMRRGTSSRIARGILGSLCVVAAGTTRYAAGNQQLHPHAGRPGRTARDGEARRCGPGPAGRIRQRLSMGRCVGRGPWPAGRDPDQTRGGSGQIPPLHFVNTVKTPMHPLHIVYLNGPDIAQLALTDAEILRAVDETLAAQGRGEVVIEPRVHLVPENSALGHFNVLRGVVRPLGLAGVKVVGDFVHNHEIGLPSEIGMLTLFDPATGVPLAILNATSITDMRTGAMTALGARYLARRKSRVLGHIGARGTSYWNVRLLCHFFDFDEIRIHSKRPASRNSLAARLSKDLGRPVVAVADWESCVRGADIVVEASRLEAPQPLLKTEWIKRGALVIPYGTMSAVELSLTDIMDKVVVDDWGQCRKGLPFGALRQHVDLDKLTADTLHAELGQIAAKLRPGRENDAETILFWHRGLSLSDIALGSLMLDRAGELSIGQTLRFE